MVDELIKSVSTVDDISVDTVELDTELIDKLLDMLTVGTIEVNSLESAAVVNTAEMLFEIILDSIMYMFIDLMLEM